MAAKDRARGKQFERHVGRIFGGRRRRAGEGLEFDDCVEIDGSKLPVSLECKAYSVLQLRQAWVDQAIRNSGGRPWVIAQRPKGSRRIYATVDLEWLVELCTLVGLISPTVREGEVAEEGTVHRG